MVIPVWGWSFVLIIAVFVVGCGSAEERKASYMSKAQEFFQEGNFPKARVALRNVVKIDPKDPEAYFLLGQVAEKEDNWPKAFGFYRQVVDIEPTHRPSLTRLARFFLAAQKKDNVSEIAEEMLKQDPNDTLGKTLNASILFMEGKKPQSLALAESLVTRNPTDPDTVILLSALFSAHERFEQATALLHQGIAAQPENIDVLNNLAVTYLRTGKVQKAEEIYRRFLTLEPKVFAHREKLARFYWKLKEPEKALALMQEAVDLEPDNEDRWKNLVRYSKPDDREHVLQQAIETLPYSKTLRLLLGQWYEQNQEFQKARDVYEALAAEEETTDEGLKAEVQLAKLDLTESKKDLANSRLEKVLEASPRQPDALVLKGKMALVDRQSQQAVQAFRTVLKDEPNQSAVQSLLGQSHLLSGEFDLAKESFEKAIELNSRQLDAYLALARLSTREGNLGKAEEHLQAILKEAPQHLESLGLLFKLHLARKQWEPAETTLKRLRKAGGKPYSIDLAEGLLAQSQQQWDRALQAYHRAKKAKPDALEPLASIVKVEVFRKRVKQVQKFLETLVAEQPEHPFASGLLATVYVQQKNLPGALEAFEWQTQINPGWEGPWKNWATVTWAEGRKTEAIDILKAGTGKNPESLALLASLASFYQANGQIDLAIQQYETILEKNPNSIAAANNLGYLYADSKGDPESLKKALAITKDFETDNPNPLLLDTLAWVNYKMGLNNEALGLLRNAVKMAPKHPLLNYHYGVVALKAGDSSTAKKHLELAVNSKPEFEQIKEARQLLDRLNHSS